MSKVDSNDSLVYLWKVWRIVGAYPYAKLKWLHIICVILVLLVTDVVSPLLVFINIAFLKDPASVMLNLQISPSLVVSTLKQGVVFYRISDLYRIRQYLNELDERANRHKEEIDYLRKIIKQCHFIAMAMPMSIFGSLTSYAIIGLYKGRLVFEGWLPFDWTASIKAYIIAFLFQLFATAFQCLQNAANDSYPSIFINVVIGHIRVLGMRVARIGKDPNTTQEENYNELTACVKDHRNIIRLFETVKPVISNGVLIQYIITAFVMCVALIHYLLFERTYSQMLSTMSYVLCILGEIFPVCYFGNALMDVTQEFTTAIYSCNWIDQSTKFRKAIIIYMQRSQKVNVILAGDMAIISLQTFLSIIQFSFSMFTVLSQLA